jgi:hypothetical protein
MGPIASELREVRKTFGAKSEGGARRTQFAEAGDVEEVPLEAMIDREPVTIVCSQMGWIRAMKGHIDLSQELKFATAIPGASCSTPRPPTSSCSSARRGGSTRSRRRACPAGAVWASLCA